MKCAAKNSVAMPYSGDIPTGEYGCPTILGRTAKELYVKLVVINFTVLYSYAHLLRDRKEPWIIARVIFCCLWPFIAVWHVLLPLVAIPTQALLHRGKWTKIEQAIAITLGPFDGDGMAAPPALMKEWLRRASGPTQSVPTQYVRSSIGNAVTGCVLVAQSITSLWLIQRRANAGALLDVDLRVFQPAVAGLCTGTMLITLSIPIPVYPPDSDGWLVLVRQRKDLKDFLISLSLQVLTGAWLLPLICLWSGRQVVVTDLATILSHPPVLYPLLLYLVPMIGVASVAVGIVGITHHDLRRALPPKGSSVLFPLAIIGTFFALLLFGLICGSVLSTGTLDYLFLFQNGIERSDVIPGWTTTPPCHSTWTDPAAEWVWWLA